MTSAPSDTLFFLGHKMTVSPDSDRQLSTAARLHVSRQARLKLEQRPRTLKFIPYSPTTRGRHGLAAKSKDCDQRESAVAANANIGRGHGNSDVATLPLTPASTNSLDPFDSGAVSAPTKDEQFLLDYAFRRMIPGWGESAAKERDFAKSWIYNVLESAPVFYSQVVGSYIHYSICNPNDDRLTCLLKTGLQRKVQAIRALRSKLEQYKAGSPEVDRDLIPAIFILAVHGTADLSIRPEPHPLSPLATMRSFHIYGRMKFAAEHINALYYLVQQKGGLTTINKESIGYVLPLLDLHYSVRNESHPMFPCVRELKPILQSDVWNPDMEATQMFTTMAEALRLIPETSCPAPAPNIFSILEVMVEITVALDHYCRGGPGAPESLNVLLNNCDWVCHTLLSIPPYLHPASYMSDLEEKQSDHDITTYLHELTRLCALLYVDMVIYPTPPHTGIKLRISTKILRLIDVIQQGNLTEDYSVSEFITWAAVLGAIGARFSELQASYSEYIEKIARETDWDTIHPRLKRYLWFGQVCDEPASRIWLGARNASRQAKTKSQS